MMSRILLVALALFALSDVRVAQARVGTRRRRHRRRLAHHDPRPEVAARLDRLEVHVERPTLLDNAKHQFGIREPPHTAEEERRGSNGRRALRTKRRRLDGDTLAERLGKIELPPMERPSLLDRTKHTGLVPNKPSGGADKKKQGSKVHRALRHKRRLSGDSLAERMRKVKLRVEHPSFLDNAKKNMGGP